MGAMDTHAGLDGPSRTIIVTPHEEPAPPREQPREEPAPERVPEREREPEKVPA